MADIRERIAELPSLRPYAIGELDRVLAPVEPSPEVTQILEASDRGLVAQIQTGKTKPHRTPRAERDLSNRRRRELRDQCLERGTMTPGVEINLTQG